MNQLYKKIKADRIVQLPEGMDIEFRFIPGGTFLQGSEENQIEQPIHNVVVSDFYLGIYPITNSQFAAFLRAYGQDTVKGGQYAGQEMIYEENWGFSSSGSLLSPPSLLSNHPVTGVSWYGAYTFCHWLSEKTGQTFRLPSESEWEYAARGGCFSLGFPFAGSKKLEEVGWYFRNSHGSKANTLSGQVQVGRGFRFEDKGETRPVGLKAPNELGLYDVSGNVWEWCEDDVHDNYKNAPMDGSAWLDGNPSNDFSYKVLRGGSCLKSSDSCRITHRTASVLGTIYRDIGFRVAMH